MTERDRPEWCEISTSLSTAGMTLIELAGNIVGCQSRLDGSRVPGRIYRQTAREGIERALAALDRLDQSAAEEDRQIAETMQSARAAGAAPEASL